MEAGRAGEIAWVIMEFSTLHDTPRTSPADVIMPDPGTVRSHQQPRYDTLRSHRG